MRLPAWFAPIILALTGLPFAPAFAQAAEEVPAPLPRHYWQEMSTEEFAALDMESVIAVFPVATIEQHGPHLPVCADACANEAVIARMLAILPDGVPVTVLPMIPVGKSNEHSAFPGTLTVSDDTLRRYWTEIAESVHRAGIRKLVFFNSHGGQPQVLDIVARDLRVRLDMFVVVVNNYALYPADLFPEEESRFGIHGGSVETSVMLYLRPDLVDMSRAEDFSSLAEQLEGDYEHLSPTGSTRFAWQAQDLNPAGVVGNAADADAERGERLVDHAARQLAEILAEVDRYPLAKLRQGPLESDDARD